MEEKKGEGTGGKCGGGKGMKENAVKGSKKEMGTKPPDH